MSNLRNVAIVAHVDHGKTTLVDQMLKQCSIFRDNQVVQERFLDSNDLERERGITILSKNISVKYKSYKINLIDTPGHADFGGEVERVLKMADGILLLVDAFEGVMPQTRFVLQKALLLGLKPLVVINKIDRPDSRPEEVLEEVFDLFVELDANDDQLDFPTIYASGRDGWAANEADERTDNLEALFDTIIEKVPAPKFIEGPTQMQITSIDYNDYIGRVGIGRVHRGDVRQNQPLVILKQNGKSQAVSVKKLQSFEGIGRETVEHVNNGDICAIVGVEGIEIGDTLADPETPEALGRMTIDEPTISMMFMVNNSPFFGKEGQFVTSRQLRERLEKEMQIDVALRVEETGSPDRFKVYGRGILHLSIFMENMRRQGYELQVGQPQVIFRDVDGKKHEPIEVLVVDVPADYSGKVIELAGQRRGELREMNSKGNMQHLEFLIPSRGLMGLRNRLLTATAGEAVMHHRFHAYGPHRGEIPQRVNGALISMAAGPSTPYAIDALQDRGTFFIKPGDVVYKGQVIGENNKDNDLEVNIQRSKKLTNMRASGSDKAVKVAPPVIFSLEEALEYINNDELVEITPESIRLRKIYLDENDRKRARQNKPLHEFG
ncbi:MAG: translational GTPase TypA [Calditrichia bacterium]